MRKIEEEPPMQGAPTWITTFVDMTSLLVTFFILLFTFSSIQEYDSFTFKKNFLGTRGVIESEKGPAMVEPPDNDIMSAMDVARGASIPHVRSAEQLSANLEEMGRRVGEGEIELDPKEVRDGLRVHFGPQASFAPGSDEVSPALERRLVELASVLQHYPYMIVVEGFTDSAFQPSQAHPDALALSAARATNAARAMVAGSGLAPALVQVSGLGSTRALNEQATAAERTLNRRVEVQILSIPQALAERIEDKGF